MRNFLMRKTVIGRIVMRKIVMRKIVMRKIDMGIGVLVTSVALGKKNDKKIFSSKIDFVYNSIYDKLSECLLNNSIRNDKKIVTYKYDDGYNNNYSIYINEYLKKLRKW